MLLVIVILRRWQGLGRTPQRQTDWSKESAAMTDGLIKQIISNDRRTNQTNQPQWQTDWSIESAAMTDGLIKRISRNDRRMDQTNQPQWQTDGSNESAAMTDGLIKRISRNDRRTDQTNQPQRQTDWLNESAAMTDGLIKRINLGVNALVLCILLTSTGVMAWPHAAHFGAYTLKVKETHNFNTSHFWSP